MQVVRVLAWRFWTSYAIGLGRKEKDHLRDCVAEKDGVPFSLVAQAG